MRILVVEDDEALGNGVQTWLRLKGYTVDLISDGQLAQRALMTESYGLVILDIGIPSMDGTTLLRWVRDRQDLTPVIVITARNALKDRIQGLDGGADDYLIKPFEMEELAARIRSLERRIHQRAASTLQHGDVNLNPATMVVTKNGVPVNISPREFAVLRELLENRGKPIPREQLERLLYAWGDGVESNTISVHVHNLRKKLGEDFIVTKRGFGYLVK
jgi:DNA-binding response OmpR family regulator